MKIVIPNICIWCRPMLVLRNLGSIITVGSRPIQHFCLRQRRTNMERDGWGLHGLQIFSILCTADLLHYQSKFQGTYQSVTSHACAFSSLNTYFSLNTSDVNISALTAICIVSHLPWRHDDFPSGNFSDRLMISNKETKKFLMKLSRESRRSIPSDSEGSDVGKGETG